MTFTVSLPSFFVLNTLLVWADWRGAIRARFGAGGATIILASLAPLTAVWYLSFANYQWAILVNAILFGIASIAAQMSLRRTYRRLMCATRVIVRCCESGDNVCLRGASDGLGLRLFVG